MVVIVREEKQGKMIKVYKTGGDKVTPAVTKMADAQDKKIEKKMREIEKILKTRKPKTTKKYKSLIELKEKKGLVLELWYELGKMIRPFVDGLNLRRGDRKYIWRAINDHAKDLKSAREGEVRLDRDPDTAYWGYCYRLAAYDWEDVKAFDWTQWADILDNTVTSSDDRIIFWAIKMKKENFKEGSLQEWFRKLRLEINDRLKNYHTEILDDKELKAELDVVFEKFKKSAIYTSCSRKR